MTTKLERVTQGAIYLSIHLISTTLSIYLLSSSLVALIRVFIAWGRSVKAWPPEKWTQILHQRRRDNRKNRSQIDPKTFENRPKIDPKSIKNRSRGSQMGPWGHLGGVWGHLGPQEPTRPPKDEFWLTFGSPWGPQVGSQNRSKIDQKRNLTWEGILASIFHGFWWILEAKLAPSWDQKSIQKGIQK